MAYLTNAADEKLIARLAGRVLNRNYRLLEPIAIGGMAIVFKARHEALGDHCAVKIIRESEASREKLLQRFRREAQVTRFLAQSTPHIISIYDFGAEADIGFFYVMELLNGQPLSALLKVPQMPPPYLWTCHTFSNLCEALAIVHQAGLVHRDIKSENVFLHRTPDGREIVKLLDFGLVRPIFQQESALTTYGRVMGTPEYMSPEQCKGPSKEQYQQGINHLDGRSDIYSLGVLLYQCLTGSLPFPMPPGDGGITQVMAGHVMHRPTPPVEKRPDLRLPQALSDVVMQALEKKPESRFQTMLGFRKAILASIGQAV
jgi:serine/threonine-protein kinase